MTNASAQSTDDPQRVSISLRKDQVEEAMKIMKKSDVMNFRVQKNKTVTDEDIAWISNVVLKQETPPVVKFECLKPLSFLDRRKLEPSQSQRIGRIFSFLLSDQDEKTDPAGIVKSYTLVLIKQILTPQDFASEIKRLSKDKRQYVRSMAESLLSRIR